MSRPLKDREGRLRKTTTAFRMSEEEVQELNSIVAFTGMTKQDYLISRALERDIIVTPTIRVQKMMSAELHALAKELSRLSDSSEVGIRLQELSETIVDLLTQMHEAGMTAESDGSSIREEEESDLRLVLPPEGRQVPATPKQAASVKRRRKVPKGFFKG